MDKNQIPMWYVLSVKTNCEKKVQAGLIQMVRNYDLQNEILNVVVPETEKQIVKRGVPTIVKTVDIPGYVYVKCIMNSDIWHKVCNSSQNVRGFLGMDKDDPSPLEKKKAEALEAYCRPKAVSFSLQESDACIITNGAWKDTKGVVKEVDHNGKVVTVEVELFQRKVPITLSFAEVKSAS